MAPAGTRDGLRDAWRGLGENPVYHRECRRQARTRRVLWVVPAPCLSLVAGAGLGGGVWALLATWVLWICCFTLVPFGGFLLAAMSVWRDRHGGTWDDVLLTRLTRAEIAMGRLAPVARDTAAFLAAPVVAGVAVAGAAHLWFSLPTQPRVWVDATGLVPLAAGVMAVVPLAWVLAGHITAVRWGDWRSILLGEFGPLAVGYACVAVVLTATGIAVATGAEPADLPSSPWLLLGCLLAHVLEVRILWRECLRNVRPTER